MTSSTQSYYKPKVSNGSCPNPEYGGVGVDQHEDPAIMMFSSPNYNSNTTYNQTHQKYAVSPILKVQPTYIEMQMMHQQEVMNTISTSGENDQRYDSEDEIDSRQANNN